ncbi:MAG TPA: hypothetical protein VFO16_04605 [Pseudonocardiaceae bacterium]|nr:hypothetical protein [Pseudonocardiaceae bacterium]
MPNTFEQNGAQQLAGIDAQQRSVAAAVAAGELWMEAGVAERAAARCEQAIKELDDSLRDADQLTRLRKFGDNEDGHAAAARFAQAGTDYIATMRKAQQVFQNMAVTYRAAGRTVSETEAANEQMFRGRSQ